jgi:hypothetical protein
MADNGSRIISVGVEFKEPVTMSNVVQFARRRVTGEYAVVASDHLIGANAAEGDVVVTLPLASSVPNTMFVVVDETVPHDCGEEQTKKKKKKGKGGCSSKQHDNVIVVRPSGSDTIDGSTSPLVLEERSVTVYSDGESAFFSL